MNHIACYLKNIHFERKTGHLIFRRGSVVKHFFFEKGNLVQVKTNQPEERVGEVLLKLERISGDDHARMDSYIEPNRNIGEVLKGRGIISEQDLSDALTQQMRETALNTFRFFDAEITYQDQPAASGPAAESKISIPFLIEYGIRRMQSDPALKGFFSRKTPQIKRKSFAYLLTAEERDILDRITGTDTSEAILKTLTAPPDFFWKSLYLFYCLDLVDMSEPGAAAPPQPEPKGWRPAPSQPSAPGAAGPPAAESAADISEVLAFRELLATKNFYQILEVTKSASEEDIKKAYFQMARRFHPDRFDRKTAAEFKGQIDEVFDAITNAYRVLSNKEARKAYDAKGGEATQEDFQDSVRKADVKFRQGKTLYSQERYDEAIGLLEEAIRVRKDKGDYYLLLAMTESRVPGYLKKAEEDFLRAISLEPWNPEAYVGLGLLYKKEGLQTKATRMFEKALEVEPEHAKAREEYEALTEGDKKKGLKAFFSGDMFGSKKKKK